MGAGASVNNPSLAEELQKPLDASDLTTPEAATEEVKRLRALLASESKNAEKFNERLTNACMGALVGNASCMPTEWFYLEDKWTAFLADADPLFYPKPSSIWFHDGTRTEEEYNKLVPCNMEYVLKWCTLEGTSYPGHYKFGSCCPTGEVMLGMLSLLAKKDPKASVDGMEWAKDMQAYYKAYTGRPSHSMTEFLKNMDGPGEEAPGADVPEEEAKKAEEAKQAALEKQTVWPKMGADNTMAECFAKIVPAVMRYGRGGLDLLLKNVEVIVRTQQNCADSKAVLVSQFLAQMLFLVAGGTGVKDAYAATCKTSPTMSSEVIQKAVEFVNGSLDKPLIDCAKAYGTSVHGEEKHFIAKGCMNPHAFILVLNSCLRNTSFEDAMRENARVSGDSSERGIAIGAILGAASESGIPEALLAKCTDAENTKALAQVLLA